MSVTLLDGGTTSTAGGSNQVFDATPTKVNDGREYADVAETDFYSRQKVVVTVKGPSQQADGEYSKHRVTAKFVMPITLASGSISYMTGEFAISYHPEATSAQVAELQEMAAQLPHNADLADTITAGTLP